MDNSLPILVDNNATGGGSPNKLSAWLKALSVKVWQFIKARAYLYPSFFVPVGAILIVYAVIGVFPFGERSILTLDMNAQYIYYFEQMRDIFTGNGSLIYTWERVLGGEFLGFFTYYASSPFLLILILFPSSLIVEAVTLIMILKCGISGLCFAIYLDKTGRRRDFVSFAMFSTMYALCAYAMAYQSNTMWMDALMWLPLLTLGIERIATTGHFKLYTIMLALIIWSNYYIGFMACIYTLIYFICFICSKNKEELNPLCEKGHIWKSFLRIGVCTVVALMIVCVIILCAIYSISFGKTDGTIHDMTFELRFDFLDFIAKMFIGSYDTVRPAGMPNVYCGILALFMLPLYFMSKRSKPREKIAYGILTIFLIACMSIDALDLIWHGLQMPVWLNYRYSFMFSFILLIMAYKGFEALSDFEYKNIIQIGAGLILLVFVIQKTVLLPRFEGSDKAPIMPDYELVWLSLIFIVTYLAILYYKKRESVKRVFSYVLLGIVTFEACVSGIINWGEEVNDVGWAKRNVYRDFIDEIEPTVDMILENDKSFYRLEKTLFRKPNENFALDIRGLSASTSTFNKDVMNLMKNCGFSARSHWSKYFEGNELVDSIFGIKYVVSKDIPVSHIYTPLEGKNGLTVYKNPYALSIAYCVDAQMKELERDKNHTLTPYRYLEYLVSGMTGEENLRFYSSCYYSYFEKSNCTKSGTGSNERYSRSDSNRKASFTYAVSPYTTGSIYMYLKPNGSIKEATYYINDESAGKVFGDESNRIHCLGTFEAGQTIYVKVEFNDSYVSIDGSYPLFFQLDTALFESTFTELAKGNMVIEDYSDTKFEGKITAEENEIVMTTIPYDKYWQVYVDGERVETYEVLDSLLAFDISAGEHTIKLKYSSTVFNIGITVTLVGIALFALMCVFEEKIRRLTIKSVQVANDAEGDLSSDEPNAKGLDGEGDSDGEGNEITDDETTNTKNED